MNIIYDCSLYQLVLNQKQKLEFSIQQNINLLLDIVTYNFTESEKFKKIEEQRILNVKNLKKINEEIIKFNHCEKCLLEKNNEKEKILKDEITLIIRGSIRKIIFNNVFTGRPIIEIERFLDDKSDYIMDLIEKRYIDIMRKHIEKEKEI